MTDDSHQRSDHHKQLRERSGSVDTDSDLVSFFYELLRDHLSAGTVESIAINSKGYGEGKWQLTNGWTAKYAKDLVKRLLFSAKDLETLDYILKLVQATPLADGEGQKRFDAVALIERLRNP